MMTLLEFTRAQVAEGRMSGRFPAPIGPKAAPMPADHGLRLKDGDRIQNRGEQSVYPD